MTAIALQAYLRKLRTPCYMPCSTVSQPVAAELF